MGRDDRLEALGCVEEGKVGFGQGQASLVGVSFAASSTTWINVLGLPNASQSSIRGIEMATDVGKQVVRHDWLRLEGSLRSQDSAVCR